MCTYCNGHVRGRFLGGLLTRFWPQILVKITSGRYNRSVSGSSEIWGEISPRFSWGNETSQVYIKSAKPLQVGRQSVRVNRPTSQKPDWGSSYNITSMNNLWSAGLGLAMHHYNQLCAYIVNRWIFLPLVDTDCSIYHLALDLPQFSISFRFALAMNHCCFQNY